MKTCFNMAAAAGALLVLALALAGCPQPSGGGGDSFIAVIGITGLPNTATAGIPLALTGMVEPVNATNQTITWSVTNAGSTGAVITNGNILTASAAGTVRVTVTIANGTASGNYTWYFDITVSGGSSGGNTAVTGFSLDSKVTAPVRDAQPVTGPIDAAQYTGTIAWQTGDGAAHSGAFAASTVYKAVVTLTAKSGYTFTGLAANSFTYSGAAQVTNAANSGTVTITFPATAAPGEDTVVNTRSLDGKITAPVRGAYPDTTAINETQYTGTVAWLTSGGAAHTGAFAAETVYRAVVTLAAKPGYTFTGVGADRFTYTGATVINAADSGTVTIVFPATEAEDAVVSVFSLDGRVTAPVRGASPDTTAINEAQYTGTIAWQTSNGAAHSGAFAASAVYRAVVTLTAKPGWTFTGVGANSFTYTGAASVTNAANSGTITIVFPATAAPGADTAVNTRSLDGKVTAPVWGAYPDTAAINETQYTGTIVWQTSNGAAHSGAFAAETVYKAIITLSVKSGYTFTGVGAGSFTYSGATSITNAANSGVVTITFPATAGEDGPGPDPEPAVVSAFSLDGKITTPVWGATPITTAINGTQYAGTIVWQTSGGATHTGAFAASAVYKAIVTLTPKTGYTFTGVAANSFTYSGAAQVTNAANSGTVIIVFPATAGEDGPDPEPAVVSAFSLDGKVTAPVRDASPVTVPIDTAQYTGSIAWQTSGGAAHTGAFAAETVYKAVVTLTARSGWTFTGVGAGSFTYTGAAQVANATNSGTVIITFPATAAAVVSAFSLDGKVTVPVWGAYPDTTAINESQYTGSIAWQTSGGAAHTGAFAAETVYKAVVTLAARSGWTFTGVGANSFAYTGAAQVANAANSGTVTIAFPATADPSAPAGISISFTGPANNDITVDGGFKLSKSDSSYSSITISVGDAGNYDAFRWLVDGGVLAGETGNSVTLNASDYSTGAYWLTVIAEKAGVPYSREFSFAVVN